MNKVLIDRALLERAVYGLELAYETDTPTVRDICAVLSAPSGTPAMPVKAYYHEAPNEYGGLNKSVGLEQRKTFSDEPLVLESDALARIACLEGEIAKRDEELTACRVAVENCELFRARIAELEADLTGTQSRVLSLQKQWRKLDAELSAIKAQGVVMPERETELFNAAYGAAVESGWESVKCMARQIWDAARLNAAPVQQVSVPDTWLVEALKENNERVNELHVMTNKCRQLVVALWRLRECLDPGDYMGELSMHAFIDEALSSAQAAPAADGGMVDALDYQVLFDAIAEATSVYANGAVNISVRAFRDAIAAHRAKGVV